MICPHCQQEHLDKIKFCPNTGKKVETVTPDVSQNNTGEFCVNCGKLNQPGFNFCGSCGTQNVKEVTASVPPSNEVETTGTQNVAPINESTQTVATQTLATTPTVHPTSAPTSTSVETQSQQKVATADVAATVQAQLDQADLKGNVKKYIEKVKATPLMVFPAILTIVLLFIAAIYYSDRFESNIHITEDLVGFNIRYLLDEDNVKKRLQDDFGSDAKIHTESFPLVSTMALIMNQVPFNFEVVDGEERDKEGHSVNVLLTMLLFPIVCIVIGSIVYGVLAKRHNWKIRDGVISFAAIYTVFMAFMALLGNYSLTIKYTENGEVFKNSISLSPSIFTAMFNGLLLSSIISFIVIYITYYGKNVFKQLQLENMYTKFTFYAVSATVVGIIVHILLAKVALKDKLADFSNHITFADLPLMLDSTLEVILGLGGWGSSYFGNFSIERIYTRNQESISLSEFALSKIVLVIITLAILVAVGYLLTKVSSITYKEMAIFAVIFAAVQIVYMYFFNINVEITRNDQFSDTTMSISYFRGTIGSFVIAFAGVFGGSYLRTYLANRPKQ